jgi:DNA modification methylase
MAKKKSELEPAINCAHTSIDAIGELKPNLRNPNKHPPKQIELLAKNIKGLGWRHPIVVSKRSGLVVCGHARLEAAKKLGIKHVPVDLQDYDSDEDEKAALIADNRIAELAEMDLPGLKDILQDLDTGAFDMDLTGFANEALEELMLQCPPESEVDAEPQTDRAEELREEWGVKTGQVWSLGDHRLMCGDSTKAEDVARLLGDRKPLLMVTDPPYGVEYDANWRNEADRANGKPYGAQAVGKVTNDDRADWREAWALFPGDVAYVWHAMKTQHAVAASLIESGIEIRAEIVWAKSSLVISQGHYHPQHESCFYAVRKGATGHWAGDHKQTTLWQIDKPHKSETGHSTQKPVECMARPMRNHDAMEVYDPFCGSGTSIIASEQLGRKCYAMEIAQGYVAVTLQRFKDATGKTPELSKGA